MNAYEFPTLAEVTPTELVSFYQKGIFDKFIEAQNESMPETAVWLNEIDQISPLFQRKNQVVFAFEQDSYWRFYVKCQIFKREGDNLVPTETDGCRINEYSVRELLRHAPEDLKSLFPETSITRHAFIDSERCYYEGLATYFVYTDSYQKVLLYGYCHDSDLDYTHHVLPFERRNKPALYLIYFEDNQITSAEEITVEKALQLSYNYWGLTQAPEDKVWVKETSGGNLYITAGCGTGDYVRPDGYFLRTADDDQYASSWEDDWKLVPCDTLPKYYKTLSVQNALACGFCERGIINFILSLDTEVRSDNSDRFAQIKAHLASGGNLETLPSTLKAEVFNVWNYNFNVELSNGKIVTIKEFGNHTLDRVSQVALHADFKSDNWSQDNWFSGIKLGKDSVSENGFTKFIETLGYGRVHDSNSESAEGFFLIKEEDHCPNDENSHYITVSAKEITQEEAVKFLLK